jgi:lysophospholipase L1-like esterase
MILSLLSFAVVSKSTQPLTLNPYQHRPSLRHFASSQRNSCCCTSLQMVSPAVIRIFCYGDSLTHGSCPPSYNSFPYGPHLERELNQSINIDDTTDEVEVVVRWRGLPGWTSASMVQYLHDPKVGLRSAIDGISSVSLVVILAGTNDIGALTCGGGTHESNHDVNAIIDPIIQLHRACLDCCNGSNNNNNKIKTIALGIPGSAWQKHNPKALQLCNEVNNGLRQFASTEERVTYVDFPIPYTGEDEWNVDGLHMSKNGYEALGIALVPYVKGIILGTSGDSGKLQQQQQQQQQD